MKRDMSKDLPANQKISKFANDLLVGVSILVSSNLRISNVFIEYREDLPPKSDISEYFKNA